MRVVTGTRMQQMDNRAINEHSIPGLILMENAGYQAVRASFELLGQRVAGKTVHLVVGTGNNGGDGLVAARHLKEMGACVRVFLVGDVNRVQGDARVMLQAWTGRGEELRGLTDRVRDADLIVDGLMGTGCHGALRSPMKEAVACINRARVPVLALDIPSGVDADTGSVHGEAIHATMTVTFALPKLGLLLYPGADYTGRIVVAPITMPVDCYRDETFTLIDNAMLRGMLPPRRSNAHKGSHGRIMVIGGSRGLGGSTVLAARAALRSGAGLVTVAVPEPVLAQVATSLAEAMTVGLGADEQGRISPESTGLLLERAEIMDAVAIGPGLGRGEGVAAVVNRFLDECSCPVVVDADALNALSPVRPLSSAVLTPHPGEAARLLHSSVSDIERDRVAASCDLAKRFAAVAVLKGARTLIATPKGEVFLEPTVNPLLATGGTGDVLTGVVAAWLGQGLDRLHSAVTGVHLHATASLLMQEWLGHAGLLAGELADCLPAARRRVEEDDKASDWLWDSAPYHVVSGLGTGQNG